MTTNQKLKLSIDTGTSGTKFAYQWHGSSPQFEIMSPWCAEVSEATARSKASLSSGELPHIESSWVTDADGFYLLGLSAERYYGSGFETGERKFMKALYKILGVIGSLAASNETALDLELGVVLPYSEYATKNQLELELRAAFKTGFQYCDRPIKVELKALAIRPEGAGVYLHGLDPEVNKSLPVASLVMGQRNSSWLTAVKGAPVEKYCNTNNLGFRWIVEEVSKRTGFTDEMMLTETIFRGKNLPSEVQRVLPEVLPQYWKQLSAWLDKQVQVSHVVASGGSALYFKKMLTKKYRAKLSWAEGLEAEIKSCGIDDLALVRRNIDCYGVLKAIGGGVAVEVAA